MSGLGPANEPYLIYFGERVVGGGTIAGNGAFRATLIIGDELPSPSAVNLPVTVRLRRDGSLLRLTGYTLNGRNITFDNNTLIQNLTCIVPQITPTITPAP